MKRIEITIGGRVQGVGFRYFVHKQAVAYGISGFVRNLPNGSVYVEAEAEKHNLELFCNACKQGPNRAFVKSFVEFETPTTGVKGFEIRI